MAIVTTISAAAGVSHIRGDEAPTNALIAGPRPAEHRTGVVRTLDNDA
jgi:hypothetical protein